MSMGSGYGATLAEMAASVLVTAQQTNAALLWMKRRGPPGAHRLRRSFGMWAYAGLIFAVICFTGRGSAWAVYEPIIVWVGLLPCFALLVLLDALLPAPAMRAIHWGLVFLATVAAVPFTVFLFKAIGANRYDFPWLVLWIEGLVVSTVVSFLVAVGRREKLTKQD